MKYTLNPSTIRAGAVALFVGICLLIAPSSQVWAEQSQEEKAKHDSKFDFPLADLGDGGYTDADGNRRPHVYEYCVPKNAESIRMVGDTDPLGRIEPTQKGAIGCSEDELLATGNTGQINYVVVLRAIASHDYVKKIILVKPE